MQNPEQPLVLELTAAVNRAPLPSSVYRDYLDPARALGTGGSENWRIVGEAVFLRQAVTTFAGATVADGTASIARLDAWFTAQLHAWMGSELNSTIYGPMYVCAVASIADTLTHLASLRALSDLESRVLNAALAWLAFYLYLCDSCRCLVTGRVLQVGDRSGDRDPTPAQVWANWYLVLASGGSNLYDSDATLTTRAKTYGLAPAHAWQILAARPLAATFCAAWDIVTASPYTPTHTTASPIRIRTYHASRSRVVWMERSHNGNTPALLAAASIAHVAPIFADYAYLPPRGGVVRIRSQYDHATCTLDTATNALVYSTSLKPLAPPDGRATIALPSDAEYTDVTIGG